MEDVKLNAAEQEIWDIILDAKKVLSYYKSTFLIIFITFVFLLIGSYYLNRWREGGIAFYLGIFIGLIQFIKGFVSYIKFTVKSYKILLKSNINDLSINNIQRVKRWWLCPIANLYKPYQVLRDIHKYVNLSIWKKWNNRLIIMRRIFFLLWLCSLISLGFILILVSFFMFDNIMNNLIKSYQIYLDNNFKNQK